MKITKVKSKRRIIMNGTYNTDQFHNVAANSDSESDLRVLSPTEIGFVAGGSFKDNFWSIWRVHGCNGPSGAMTWGRQTLNYQRRHGGLNKEGKELQKTMNWAKKHNRC
jgi:hypothetical protein